MQSNLESSNTDYNLFHDTRKLRIIFAATNNNLCTLLLLVRLSGNRPRYL